MESIIRQLSQHGTGGNLIIIRDNDLVMTPILQRAAATAPPRATRPVSARARAPAAGWTPGPRSDPGSGPPPASAGPAPCGDPAQVGQVLTKFLYNATECFILFTTYFPQVTLRETPRATTAPLLSTPSCPPTSCPRGCKAPVTVTMVHRLPCTT